MNLVLDEATEIDRKRKTRQPLGRILLKGDNITLIMHASADPHASSLASDSCHTLPPTLTAWLMSAMPSRVCAAVLLLRQACQHALDAL